MAPDINKIVQVLLEDEALICDWLKFANLLSTPPEVKVQLTKQFKCGSISVYETFSKIISTWISTSKNALSQKEISKSLASILEENGFRFCADRLGQLESERIQIKSLENAEPIFFGLKRGIKNFFGRDDELSKLMTIFNSSQHDGVVTSALGGVGKTELTKRFVTGLRESAGESNSTPEQFVISWFAGESAETLNSSIAKFAYSLGCLEHHLPQTTSTFRSSRQVSFADDGETRQNHPKIPELLDSIHGQLQRLHGKSNQNQNRPFRWVIVIDNVDEIYEEFESAASKLFEIEECFVIVTSRRRDILAGEVEHLEISELKLEDSINLVKSQLNLKSCESEQEHTAVVNLCKILQNYPLALQQAVAYIKRRQLLSLEGSKYNVVDYLKELDKKETTGLCEIPKLASFGYSNATIKVWDITISTLKEGLREVGKMAYGILEILAYLSPDCIELNFIHRIFKFCNGILLADKIEIEEALGILKLYSLIQINDQVISIHRMVQVAIRAKTQIQGGAECQLLSPIWHHLEEICFDYDDSSHLLTLWKYCSKNEQIVKNCSSSLKKIEEKLFAFDMDDERENFLEQCHSIFVRVLGENHVDSIYIELKREPGASGNGIFMRIAGVLDEKVASLGKDSKDVLEIANLLSNIDWGYLSTFDNSIHTQFRQFRVYNSIEKALGENHEISVRFKKSLAMTLRRQQMQQASVKLTEEVLQWEVENLGELSSVTLATKYVLAVTLYEMDEFRRTVEILGELISCSEFETPWPYRDMDTEVLLQRAKDNLDKNE